MRSSVLFFICCTMLISCKPKRYSNESLRGNVFTVHFYKPSFLRESAFDSTGYIASGFERKTYASVDSSITLVVMYSYKNTEPKYDFKYYYGIEVIDSQAMRVQAVFTHSSFRKESMQFGTFHYYSKKLNSMGDKIFTKFDDHLVYVNLVNNKAVYDDKLYERIADSILRSVWIERDI